MIVRKHYIENQRMRKVHEDVDKRPSFAIPTIIVRFGDFIYHKTVIQLSLFFKAATKRFDKEAENMYIKTLPLPHPGALPGSTNGCLQFEVVKD